MLEKYVVGHCPLLKWYCHSWAENTQTCHLTASELQLTEEEVDWCMSTHRKCRPSEGIPLVTIATFLCLLLASEYVILKKKWINPHSKHNAPCCRHKRQVPLYWCENRGTGRSVTRRKSQSGASEAGRKGGIANQLCRSASGTPLGPLLWSWQLIFGLYCCPNTFSPT